MPRRRLPIFIARRRDTRFVILFTPWCGPSARSSLRPVPTRTPAGQYRSSPISVKHPAPASGVSRSPAWEARHWMQATLPSPPANAQPRPGYDARGLHRAIGPPCPRRGALIRIAVNVAIDGILAAVAVPVAWWITDPAGAVPSAAFSIPFGAAALLVAGLPFRLSQQYWRFAALGDLLTVTASSALGAALFSLALFARGLGPPSFRFPIAHGADAAGVARRPARGISLVPVARAELGGRSGRDLGARRRPDRGLRPVPARAGARPAATLPGGRLADSRRPPHRPPHPGLRHSRRHERTRARCWSGCATRAGCRARW